MGAFFSSILQQASTAVPITSSISSSVNKKGNYTYHFIQDAISELNMTQLKSSSVYKKSSTLSPLGIEQIQQLCVYLGIQKNESYISEDAIVMASEYVQSQMSAFFFILPYLEEYLKSGRKIIICPYLNGIVDQNNLLSPNKNVHPLQMIRSSFKITIHNIIKGCPKLLSPEPYSKDFDSKTLPTLYPTLFSKDGEKIIVKENCWDKIFDIHTFHNIPENIRVNSPTINYPYTSKKDMGRPLKTKTNLSMMKQIYDMKDCIDRLPIFLKNKKSFNHIYLFGSSIALEESIKTLLPDIGKTLFSTYPMLHGEYIKIGPNNNQNQIRLFPYVYENNYTTRYNTFFIRNKNNKNDNNIQNLPNLYYVEKTNTLIQIPDMSTIPSNITAAEYIYKQNNKKVKDVSIMFEQYINFFKHIKANSYFSFIISKMNDLYKKISSIKNVNKNMEDMTGIVYTIYFITNFKSCISTLCCDNDSAIIKKTTGGLKKKKTKVIKKKRSIGKKKSSKK
jgi:hypothetical protein